MAACAVENNKMMIMTLQQVMPVLFSTIAYENERAMKAETTVTASKP